VDVVVRFGGQRWRAGCDDRFDRLISGHFVLLGHFAVGRFVLADEDFQSDAGQDAVGRIDTEMSGGNRKQL
jgi:hypothetical protein